MKDLTNTLIICLIVIAIYSCGDTKKANSKEHETTTETSFNADEEKQAFINKYNAYVAVWNKVSPRVESSYKSIYNTINDKNGNPLKEQQNYYITTIKESIVIKNLNKIMNEEPKIEELDALGPKLVASYNELIVPLQELSDYYKLQSYKDDDFKKASELYFKVRKPLTEFLQASDNLGAAVQIIDNKMSIEALAEYKENNKMLLYNKGMIIQSIKKSITPLYNITFDEYQSINVEDFKSNLKEAAKHYTEFKKLANNKETVKDELNISRPSPFLMYYRSIDDYIKTARGFVEILEDSKKYEKIKKQLQYMKLNPTIDSHEKLLKKAESVINFSNSLN
ncbi:uncharacterized protein DUF3829 [Maribacter vaceletii]|uniref:Uncharacterized protein DUF3829 n=1 Tax=Maribacter vaceletii TaxID=1206816 RepID=A0A495E9A2_9FLAO|nr:DUF3829 domain-containing protein [Maribacter vaceletii]RKR13502.1 uncharacterized protein DUF3829 [Maribacter vaceletii]